MLKLNKVPRIIKFLTSEELIVILLSLILLGYSYGPLVYQYLFPPPGRVFLGSFGFPTDFFGNIIYFQNGRLGHWQHVPKITSTISSKPTFIKFDYVFLGQLSRLFPIDPVIFFHLARFTLSIILIIVSYFLITQVFKTKFLRLTAFLLAFFSTSAGPGSGKLVNSWTPVSVFQRAAYYPHYLFSSIFVLLSIFFLNHALKQKKLFPLLWTTFFGFLAAQVHPPTIITLYLCLPFYLIFVLANRLKTDPKKRKTLLRKFTYLITFSLITLLPLLYLRMVSHFHPWNLLSKIDLLYSRHQVISLIELLSGIGPTAILAIFGAWLAIKKGGDLNFLLAPWAVIYIIGFFFVYKIIGWDSSRFLQTPFFVILGILSTYTLAKLAELASQKYSLRKEKIILLLMFLILVASLSAYRQSIQINWQNFTGLYPYIYSTKEMRVALNWLSQNSEENEVVLTGQTNGMLIPALSGNMPYLTIHAGPLENFAELKNNAWRFFSQNWTEKQAQDFITKERVKLVFFGQEEKELSGGKSYLDYSFLKPVFQNQEVIIYRSSNP